MKVHKLEYHWVLIYALIVMLITTVPYWIAHSHSRIEFGFSGFLFGVEDGNSYIAKMLSGAQGEWLFRTPYSAYEQKGFLAFLPYLLLGKLSSPPAQHGQLVVIFQMFRWVGGIGMIIAIYKFVSCFINTPNLRKVVVVIASIGGGFGWLSVLGAEKLWESGLPLEFYSPESFGFLAIYGLPHLAVAEALLLWGICCYLDRTANTPYHLNAMKGGGLWFLLGFFQPLTIVIGWTVISAHLLVSIFIHTICKTKTHEPDWKTVKKYFIRALWMIGISSPWVIYNLYSFAADEFLKGWVAQNIILSPKPVEYLLAYGILILFLIPGILFVVRQPSWPRNLLLGWIIIFPLLIYAPYNLQRRLSVGIWVVLTIISVIIFDNKVGKPKWIIYLLYATLLSSLVILSAGIMLASDPSPPLFLEEKDRAAFEYLAGVSTPGEVVIASYETSNPMPAWVPVRTVIGHGPESVNLEELKQDIDIFYSSIGSDQDRKMLIEEFEVKYIIWGPHEKELGDWDPIEVDFLDLIYDQEDYQIFKVANVNEK
ncbi:MAG: hypothetical protein MUO76_06665 [Anaerolineaceae bacterium]|nr:hypothetical protein [Anaerolineaceae bacterium]